MLIWSSHSSSLQSLMVLFCYGLCVNILARFLRPSFISSILFSYLSPLFILTKWLLPVFCSPKPPYVGLLPTFWLHSCLSSTPFCVPQFSYWGSHLTWLPFYHLVFALTLPSLSPQLPTFNLQPTVMSKYLPLIFYLLIISWISLFLYICC